MRLVLDGQVVDTDGLRITEWEQQSVGYPDYVMQVTTLELQTDALPDYFRQFEAGNRVAIDADDMQASGVVTEVTFDWTPESVVIEGMWFYMQRPLRIRLRIERKAG